MDPGGQHTGGDYARTAPLTIVVIDDDPISVNLHRLTLELAGYRVVPCPPDPAAWTCIGDVQPAAIVLDVHMPELDGIQLFSELRADPVTQAIPVIFVTASPQEVSQRLPDFKKQGAWVLAKPFSLEQLQATVAAVVPLLARER